MERAIQIAVARADVILCEVGAWPWGKIALSVMLAAIIVKAVKYL